MPPRITVLTPTYQRAHTLPRLHASLERQSYRDFEWLVIDDGSMDGTRELVEGWETGSRFPIRYACQPNQGKHAALNRGVGAARGELCAILDSDDWYVPEGLERLVRHWETIPAADRERFANVEGRCVDQEGRALGDAFPHDVFDSDNIEARVTLRVRGDTVGMYRTEVLREHPFPEDLGAFVTESLVWHRIALRYRSRFVNDVIGCKEYLPGGLSDRLRDVRAVVDGSRAALVYNRELIAAGRPLPLGTRVRAQGNVVRHALHQHRNPVAELGAARWPLPTLALGVALFARDRWRLTRRPWA